MWWCECKHYEQHTYQADYSKCKPRALAWQPISLECPPLQEKDQQSGDVKDGNVEPIRRLSEHAVIGVKQHRDQHKSQQDFRQFDAPVVFLVFEKQSLNQRKEE